VAVDGALWVVRVKTSCEERACCVSPSEEIIAPWFLVKGRKEARRKRKELRKRKKFSKILESF
jgi:hypothetical protein